MVFIAILLALALERFFDWSHLRRWQWFEQYCQMLSSSIDRFNPAVRLACWLLPPVLLVGLIEYILSGWIYGIVRLVFDFFVLLYCFGPTNFWAQLYDCLQPMSQGDPQLVDVRVKAAFPEVTAPTPQALHQTLVRAIYIEGERRVFGVLFWFSVFGPMGAVLYRLIALAQNKTITEMAVLTSKAQELADWLPSRVLGIFFALGGHFVKVLTVWQKYALQGINTSDILIAETGLAALDLPANKPVAENGEVEKQAIQLFDRALIIMLLLSAVLALVLP